MSLKKMAGFLLEIISPVIVLILFAVTLLPKSCTNGIKESANEAFERNQEVIEFRERCIEAGIGANDLEVIIDSKVYTCPKEP